MAAVVSVHVESIKLKSTVCMFSRSMVVRGTCDVMMMSSHVIAAYKQLLYQGE